MKKLKLTLIALLAFIVGLICFVSCGEKAPSQETSQGNKYAPYAGTYKFQALKMKIGDIEVEVKVGESYGGMRLTESYAILELKEDGGATLSMMGAPATGTWEPAEEKDKIVVTVEGDPMTMSCDGKRVNMDMEGIVFVLVSGGETDNSGGNSEQGGTSEENTEKSYAGTYKFQSMIVQNPDGTSEIKVGDIFEGLTLTENYMTLELKEDGSAVFSAQGLALTGTWAEAPEKDKIILTVMGESQTLACDKTSVRMEAEEGIVFVLKK